MANLKEVLAHLDNDIQKMSYFDVCSVICSADKDDSNAFERDAEIMVMSFAENLGHADWGSFYGPQNPNIYSQHIEYWSKRASETRNPLLKMRYAGTVWDFCKKITGKEPSYKDIKLAYIISSIEAVEQDLPEYTMSGIAYAEQAIAKSLSIRNPELKDRAIKALRSYSKKYEKDDLAGIWGRPFRFMTEHLKDFVSYEDEILSEMLVRFEGLEKASKAECRKTDMYVHILKQAAELLADYYKQKQQIDKVSEFLGRYHSCLKLTYDLRGAMWVHGMLQNLQDLYRKFNLTKEANKLYVEIQAMGGKALNELKPVEMSLPIDNKQIEEYFEPLLSGTNREVLIKYMVKYLPNIENEKQQQKYEAEQSPLMDMIRTVAYNQSGMPINNVGVGERAKEHKLSYGMYRRMMISAIFLELHIERMEDMKVYTYDNVLELFKDSPLILEMQRPLLEKGLKAYFDKDYIVACYILVPLFEAAIRNLAASTGHEVLRPSGDPKEGNEYVSLEKLLDVLEHEVEDNKDVFVYFKNLFTDKNGWNTRNLLCHGALAASAFNSTLANRIVHAFLLLSQVKLVARAE